MTQPSVQTSKDSFEVGGTFMRESNYYTNSLVHDRTRRTGAEIIMEVQFSGMRIWLWFHPESHKSFSWSQRRTC